MLLGGMVTRLAPVNERHRTTQKGPWRVLKVSAEVYDLLEKMRKPRDTFDNIIRRLLRLYSRFGHLDRE